jgi:hypothetical protein
MTTDNKKLAEEVYKKQLPLKVKDIILVDFEEWYSREFLYKFAEQYYQTKLAEITDADIEAWAGCERK